MNHARDRVLECVKPGGCCEERVRQTASRGKHSPCLSASSHRILHGKLAEQQSEEQNIVEVLRERELLRLELEAAKREGDVLKKELQAAMASMLQQQR